MILTVHCDLLSAERFKQVAARLRLREARR
jgi:hypothetical protein